MSDQRSHSGSGIFLRGMAMGAADIVPGVSGGTVAFITGIYERLIAALSAANLDALRLLGGRKFKSLWQHIDGSFLLFLFGGILFSIFSLARLISWVLEAYPHLIWAFFLGLILASILYIAGHTNIYKLKNAAAFLVGTLAAFGITQISQIAVEPSNTSLFVAGAIAICAMVLPGISGSFILVLLGMYQTIITAVKELNGDILLIFVFGCVTGLLVFTHFLNWILKRFHQLTLATLTGFMLGSVNKVWPWKKLIEDQGIRVEINVLPGAYAQDPQVGWVVCALLLGILTVYMINRLGNAS